MNLINEIEKKYNFGEPILLKEITKSFSYNKKESSIRKQMTRLTKNKKLIKVDRGIYTLMSKSITGKYKKPDFESVLEKKYIKLNNAIKGYYSDLTLLNNFGISYQVPNIKEIVTNEEKSRKRTVNIMNRKVILRKPRVYINSKNIYTLQFLDIITNFDKYADIDKSKALKRIITYFKEKKVTMKDIEKNIKFYPALTSKKILEYRVYNEFTRK